MTALIKIPIAISHHIKLCIFFTAIESSLELFNPQPLPSLLQHSIKRQTVQFVILYRKNTEPIECAGQGIGETGIDKSLMGHRDHWMNIYCNFNFDTLVCLQLRATNLRNPNGHSRIEQDADLWAGHSKNPMALGNRAVSSCCGKLGEWSFVHLYNM